MLRRTFTGALALGAAASIRPATAQTQAQAWPTKPLHIVIPYPPGGPSDVSTRIVMERAGQILGQSVLFDNKAGASGMIGAEYVKNQPVDTHTFLTTTTAMVCITRHLQPIPFVPEKDFIPVARMTTSWGAFAVHPSVPAKTVAEFVAYAKANPGKIRYSTPGAGTTLHITMEQIALQEGIKWTQVPFRGEAESTAALLGEHVEAAASGAGLGPLVDAGQIRMLVMWTPERSPRFPGVPTLVEEGQKIVSTSPYGLAGPKGMDPRIMKVLHDAFRKGMAEAIHLKTLQDLSQPAIYKNSEEYKAYAMELIAEQRDLIGKLGLAAK